MKTKMFYLIILLFMNQEGILSQNYALPFKGEDFKPGERVYTGNHLPGIQGEGEDIGVKRYLGNNQWSFNKEGTFGTKNTDLLIYGKPIYAMFEGKVIGCWCNAPENPRPKLSTDTDAGQEWLHPKFKDKQIPGGGNMLWIQHADGTRALYAHMIPGTISDNLCPNKSILFPKPLAKLGHDTWESENIYVMLPAAQQVNVMKGQYLGKAGNAGSSSGPHLHIHMEKSGMPAKMLFEQGLYKPFIENNTNIKNGWVSFDTQEIPEGEVLIRPVRTVKYRIKDFETYEIGGNRMYAGIFESDNYSPIALFKNNWNDFLKGWQDIEAQGNRMIDFETYESSGNRMYAGIFEPGSYSPVALFKNNWDDFLKGWKDIEAQGNRMIDFETYEVGGKRMYAGIFKPGSYSPVALFKNNWDDFLKGWQDIEAKGNRMLDFETYEVGGKRMYAGIFKPSSYSPVALFKNNWDDFLKGWQDIEAKGNRILDFESYDSGGKQMYVGIFKPGTYAPMAIFKNNWDDFLEAWQNLE